MIKIFSFFEVYYYYGVWLFIHFREKFILLYLAEIMLSWKFVFHLVRMITVSIEMINIKLMLIYEISLLQSNILISFLSLYLNLKQKTGNIYRNIWRKYFYKLFITLYFYQIIVLINVILEQLVRFCIIIRTDILQIILEIKRN